MSGAATVGNAHAIRFGAGARVWYVPHVGGLAYGYRHDVPAVFVRYSASRCRIALLAEGGVGPRLEVAVSPARVFARDVWAECDADAPPTLEGGA